MHVVDRTMDACCGQDDGCYVMDSRMDVYAGSSGPHQLRQLQKTSADHSLSESPFTNHVHRFVSNLHPSIHR